MRIKNNNHNFNTNRVIHLLRIHSIHLKINLLMDGIKFIMKIN